MRNKLRYTVLLVLTALVINGCGQKNDADGGLTNGEISGGDMVSSDQNTAEVTVRREPPDIELYPTAGEGDSLLVRSSGYNWNWPEGEDQMGAAIADGAAPLSEGAPWDILILPENGDGSSEYRLTIRVGSNEPEANEIVADEIAADEIGIDMWNLADIGNYNAAASRIAVYQGEEITAEDFSISLQSGKVYQIYLIWNKEKMEENGCFGIAYYVFKTAETAPDDSVKYRLAAKFILK